jgi:hypothetical protein
MPSPLFRIKSLRVGTLELRNVTASIVPMNGDLLLGESFLSRLTSWSLDNRRHVLIMNSAPGVGPYTAPEAMTGQRPASAVADRVYPDDAPPYIQDLMSNWDDAYLDCNDHQQKERCVRGLLADALRVRFSARP